MFCVLPHRQRTPIRLVFHSMGANEHMQDAIRLSRSEAQPANENPTGELESPEHSHKDQSQPEAE